MRNRFQVRWQTKRLEVGRALVVVVIAVMRVIAPVETLANFFELVAALLGQAAALAVLADGFLQILFRRAAVTAAPVIRVAQECTERDIPARGLNRLFLTTPPPALAGHRKWRSHISTGLIFGGQVRWMHCFDPTLASGVFYFGISSRG